MKRLLPLALGFLMLAFAAYAEDDFAVEVMGLEGSASLKSSGVTRSLKDGDLLKAGDEIEVSSGSSADLGFDSSWENVTRVEENSKVKIESVYPSSLDLSKGGLYAKLENLPQDSKFQVKTPTAVAVVRGTEFRTVAGDSGSEFFNFSDSEVFVYGLDESGQVSEKEAPVPVAAHEMTKVERRGEFHFRPYRMDLAAEKRGTDMRGHLDKKIGQLRAENRTGKIQDMGKVKQHLQRMKAEGKMNNTGPWPEKGPRAPGQGPGVEAGRELGQGSGQGPGMRKEPAQSVEPRSQDQMQGPGPQERQGPKPPDIQGQDRGMGPGQGKPEEKERRQAPKPAPRKQN